MARAFAFTRLTSRFVYDDAMVLSRVAPLLLLAVAASPGCDDSGATSSGSSGSSGGAGQGGYVAYAADNVANLTTDLKLTAPAFAHPMALALGTRAVAVGVTRGVGGRDLALLTLLTPPNTAVTKTFSWSDESIYVRRSSIVADGAGGFYLGGSALHTPSSGTSTEPVLSRWDASGNVLWSKAYKAVAPAFFNLSQQASQMDTLPDVALGAPVAGKLAIAAGDAVLVVDEQGAPQGAWQSPSQLHAHEVMSDAEGFTAYGTLYDALVILRFDWTAKLVWAREAAKAVPPNSLARMSLPHRRADGAVLLPYSVRDGRDALQRSGVLAIDASGNKVDNWGYEINATVRGAKNIRVDDSVQLDSRPLSDDLMMLARIVHLPYPEARDVFIYFVVPSAGAGAGAAFAAGDGPFVRLDDGRVVTFGGQSNQLGVGTPTGASLSCGHAYAEVDAVNRTNAKVEDIPAFVAKTYASSPFSVTVHDEPITSKDGGAITLHPLPACAQ